MTFDLGWPWKVLRFSKKSAELFKCRSVRRRRPSSSVRRRPSTFSCNLPFLQNCSVTFLLITHTASISCQLSPMLIWTPLKNSKGPLGPLRGPPVGQKCIFSHIMPIFSKTVQQLFLFSSIWWALFALWRWTPLNRSKGPSRAPQNKKNLIKSLKVLYLTNHAS